MNSNYHLDSLPLVQHSFVSTHFLCAFIGKDVTFLCVIGPTIHHIHIMCKPKKIAFKISTEKKGEDICRHWKGGDGLL